MEINLTESGRYATIPGVPATNAAIQWYNGWYKNQVAPPSKKRQSLKINEMLL
jgi:hypothetical protein